MPRGNQHKPLPPLEDIAPHILTYWNMRKRDTEVVQLLREHHIDRAIYGIGLTSYKSIRKSLGLISTRQQNHTFESIREPIQKLRKRFPKAGARDMKSLLFHEMKLSVPRELIIVYFQVYESKLVKERKAGRLKRRRFWAAGVYDMIAVDQHDKWLRFGLYLHNGLDPFSGKLAWVKIWWTNKNPKLILSYYLEVVEKSKSMPMITQSDPGSENYGIANAQTALRHWHDPSLTGTIQHRWMRQKKNVKPEIGWSQLRRRFTPGFEDLLELGVTNNWYQLDRPLDALVFRWVFIPFLQAELNAYVNRVNNSRKRADRNKILPHGIPNDIDMFPERFGCLNFKIGVQQEAIDYVREQFAPPGDPVFELVPPIFDKHARSLYESMGSPTISSESVWEVYRELLHRFEHLDNAVGFIQECDAYIQEMEVQESLNEAIPPAGKELLGGFENQTADGYYYMGGLNNGLGIGPDEEKQLEILDDDVMMVNFTSDEESEGDDDGTEL